jgi:hypothetical protein
LKEGEGGREKRLRNGLGREGGSFSYIANIDTSNAAFPEALD